MFSEMIQRMLNSGGQSAAIQRAMQMKNYVDSYNKPSIAPPNTANVQSFDKVLANSKGVNFGNLLINPQSMNVYAQRVNPQSSPIMPEIQKATAVSANVTNQSSKSQILDMISQVSKKHGIDEKLVKALIKQESGFNPNAKSKSGAMGLMQLMPSTAKGLGVTDAYNPVQNVDGGVRYLKSMLKKYNGNIILALAAYNAGPAAVDKYDGVPPYKETQNYVKNILANYL